MNKAYRHVYKDGIGWVAIAENGSCVSSSKGSGTVSAKTKVEVLKNFFDLRNSVVLNNGFLLKGLFAATLFCGMFVTQGFAEMTQKEILDIQNNGTAVYTDNDGNRMEKVINEDGEVIFSDGSILNKADSDGIIHVDGKDYVIPTGTLNKPDTDEFGDKAKLFRVKKDETTGEWRGLTFQELYDESGKSVTGGKPGPAKGKLHTVIYDKDKKKWFVHNQASEAQLYQAKKKNGEVAYYAWTSIQKDVNGVPLKTVDGYYMPIAKATAEANEIKNLGYDIVQVASKNKAERLSLVGIDGKTVKPIKYTKNDQEVKDGKREVGDNKNGTIRLGNVAKAELDDEAVNLGQLNERLQNVKADKVPYVSINSSIKGDGSNYDSDGAIGKEAVAIGPNAKAGDNSVAIGLSAKTGEGIIDKASYNKINRELNDVKQKYDLAVKKGNQEKVAEFGELINKYKELLKTYDERYEYNGKLITKAEFDKLNAAEQKKATIKYISKTMYENSVAIGYDAQALANDAVAIGNGAKVIAGGPKVIAGGGVAIGQGSVSNAREDKDLNGYIPPTTDKDSYEFKNNESAWIATNQPFAVGNDEKITRQITGVAAGNKDTDAVNVAQLKQVGFFISGDIGEKGRIQNDDAKEINTLHIKTDDKWENNDVVYTGRNLETKTIAGGSFNQTTKEHDKSKVQIAMSDTPRFKSITIADDDTINNKNDDSPIELKKFGDNIGFAGKGDSTIKLTNLAEGTIGENSKDAITGGQLQKIIKGGLKFTANSGEHTAELGTQISIRGAADNTTWANFDSGKNIMTNIDTEGNIVVGLSKELKNINSITTEDKGTLTIKAGDNKQYTFGDKNLVDTSVITNKDLADKGYLTSADDKTAQVTSDDGSVKITSSGDKTKIYDLKLEKSKIEELAGTKDLKDGLNKKANLDASNLTDDTNKNKWKEALGIKGLNAEQLFTAKADGATAGATIGANGELKFFGDENVIASSDTTGIKYTLNKDLKNINSITTEKGGNLIINAGDKTYTFDNGKNPDEKTNVVTNETLGDKVTSAVGASKFAIKGDNSSTGEVKLKDGLSVVGKTDSGITTKAENGKFTLSLDEDKVKDIAGTKDLADKLAAKADLNAGNLSNKTGNVNNADETYADVWKDKLGIKGLNAEQLFTAKADGATAGATIGANGELKFFGDENVIASSDTTGIKYTLNKDLKNINSITTEKGGNLIINAGDKTYTFDNGKNPDEKTNVVTNSDLKKAVKQINTQVGSVNLNIAGDHGTKGSVKLSSGALNINGDGKNITTSVKNGEVKVALNDEINLGNVGENKINLGKDGLKITQADGSKGPSITADGIAMNDKQITGLKSGLDGLGQNGKDGTIADYKKLSDAEKEKYKHNAATIGDLATVDGKIVNVSTNINNIIGDTYIKDDGNGNKTINVDKIKKDLATNSASGQKLVVADGKGAIDTIVNSIKNINTQGTRFFHVNDGHQVKGTGKDEHDSSAGSKGGVAIGMQAKVGNNAENAISIGTNSITSVASGVALGSGSVANRKALDDTTKKDVYLFDNKDVADTVANTKGAISVGSDKVGNKFTRQITGVAAGTEDSDAVNVAQLKAVQKVVNQGSKWISANPGNSAQKPVSRGEDSLAIGAGAMATGNNSVALGSGSTTVSVNGAPRDNTVSVGAPGKERTISNVAPGVLNSDAATMGQLRAGLNDVYGKLGEYKKDASAGTASALAVGNLPQATIPGKGMISLGSGFYDGQSAMAIGLSKMSDSGKWVFKGSASYDSQEKAGAALSVGFHF
ncbi:YadA-like family protein [Campylobacter ureolyticus]|uniref:YadA-like family protein n=1 Tax=Campylobacter ureolyticus TaxID=827 RepID=A0A9Q4KJL4_9BACT|nr:YadA-like family protein [Campylobacter ureolyticus]MCZ6160833.1 YadA-like family protein [Campylobacter ureolyticus]MCZ6169810.1 YadA-like family protein [Campylobacter ureolyticus]